MPRIRDILLDLWILTLLCASVYALLRSPEEKRCNTENDCLTLYEN